MISTIVIVCTMLVAAEGWPSCYGPDIPVPPPIREMPLHVTTYYVWTPDGDRMDGWGGQCDSTCRWTAAGYELPQRVEDYQGGYAACVSSWVRLKGYPTVVVNIPGYGEWRCVDAFGAVGYRQPFWHEGRGLWVVPIDLLREPAHDLVYGWTTRIE
jgi:hypothetical protein